MQFCAPHLKHDEARQPTQILLHLWRAPQRWGALLW